MKTKNSSIDLNLYNARIQIQMPTQEYAQVLEEDEIRFIWWRGDTQ